MTTIGIIHLLKSQSYWNRMIGSRRLDLPNGALRLSNHVVFTHKPGITYAALSLFPFVFVSILAMRNFNTEIRMLIVGGIMLTAGFLVALSAWVWGGGATAMMVSRWERRTQGRIFITD